LNPRLCNAPNRRCEVAPKRTKAKPGGGRSRVATNSYREVRSDAALRLRVSVSPLKPVTKTCYLADEADGLDWARGVRLGLLRQERSLSGSSAGDFGRLSRAATNRPRRTCGLPASAYFPAVPWAKARGWLAATRLMTMTRRPDGQRKSSTRDTGCCR
jgi:hypothetical protein